MQWNLTSKFRPSPSDSPILVILDKEISNKIHIAYCDRETGNWYVGGFGSCFTCGGGSKIHFTNKGDSNHACVKAWVNMDVKEDT